MQTEDFVIAITTAIDALVERITLGEPPGEGDVRHAVSVGLRTLAARLDGPRSASLAELQARVTDLEERLGAIERQGESRETTRDQAYEAAERGRDVRAATAEEERARRFAEHFARLREKGSRGSATDRSETSGPERSPGPHVLDVIAQLLAAGVRPAPIRRWLSGHGWARRSQRSAPLRQAAAELRSCDPAALAEVVALVTSEMVWPDLIDTLSDLEAEGTPEVGEVVDLAGARRRR